MLLWVMYDILQQVKPYLSIFNLFLLIYLEAV